MRSERAPAAQQAVAIGTRPAWFRPRFLLAVAAGGLLGAPARDAIGALIPDFTGRFPAGTFVVNLTGSLALGLLYGYLEVRSTHGRYVRALFGTGFIGSYTTFSTYIMDVVLLGHQGRYVIAALYLVASLVLGIALAWAGLRWGRRIGARS